MRVLIACEYSGIERSEFIAAGHETLSCDLLPTDIPGPHYQGDVFDVLADPSRFFSGPIDLMIAHPPCTDLATSGSSHFAQKRADGRQAAALDFVRALMNADVPRIAVENPKSVISGSIRKPDQIIQPWMFGHGETKETHLWLKNLPPLLPTNVVSGRQPRIYMMPPSRDRAKLRSLSYRGIAQAMAHQWDDRDYWLF